MTVRLIYAWGLRILIPARIVLLMQRAALTLTLRVVELTLQLSLDRHSRPASERQGVTTHEPRPLVQTRGPVLQLKAGAR